MLNRIIDEIWKLTLKLSVALLLFTSHCYGKRSAIHKLGDWGQYVLPAVACSIAVEKEDPIGLVQFGRAAFVTMGTIYALKFSINTRRPDRGQYSFPSGHTGIAFASAAFVERRYGARYGIPVYLAATFVGYSRIYSRKHHLIDVVTAAGIAIAANYYLTTRFHGCTISPFFCKKGGGFIFNIDR